MNSIMRELLTKPRLVRALTLALLLTADAWAAVPASDVYLLGYINALVDSRYAGLGLRATSADEQGRVTLWSEACLGPWQRRSVERLLQETGRVKTVRFDSSDACKGETDVPAPDIAAIDIHALPEQALFMPLIADPREPRFSVSYQRHRTPTGEFNAGSVAFGEYFGFASGFLGSSGASQVGLQGAVFALFNLDATSNDLVNADYWIGLPVAYRKGPWSYLLRVYHQSSHLGDEFLLGNPDVERINLSYEDLEVLASYEWERVRLYGGGGHLLHSEPQMDPWSAHMGAEFIKPGAVQGLDLIAAVDLRATEELDWERSRSYQIGFEFKNGGTRRLRLMLEHFRGHAPNGQLIREKVRYSGLGLYFGF